MRKAMTLTVITIFYRYS